MVVAPDTATDALAVVPMFAPAIKLSNTNALVPVVIVIVCAVVNPTKLVLDVDWEVFTRLMSTALTALAVGPTVAHAAPS